ncbi:transcription-repair coupling factor (superfamily II helicase) [Lactobacillus colini]|uniref:Transcription-repair-coupling factor n=1 Tax=Lactobacillus colini TaxID=1819254 RepID=A0ABS4MCE8_9LACO|nr:transcription-repair coupling factor [Lactobacillus colini]MBP2057283.1 transcription-repair coupling factor (superfamily II helicase) [Lactobacillus colini]
MQVSEIITQDKELNKFIYQAPTSPRSLITGVNDGAFSPVILQILNTLHKPLIIVEESEDKAQRLQSELSSLLGDEIVHMFPIDATIATQSAIASPDELSQRLNALNFLKSGRPGIIITIPQGLQYQLSDPKLFSKSERIFSPEKEYDLQELVDWLLKTGYQRDNLVARPGEFALRGDILDIYPLSRENPLRIEFFGDEIDTVKEFDPATQRSLQELDQVRVGGAIDRIFEKEDLEKAAIKIKQDMADSIADKKAIAEHFERVVDTLESGGLPENYAFLVDYLIKKSFSLLDYLAADGLVLYDDWTAIQKNVADINVRNEAFISEEVKAGAMLNSQSLRTDFIKVTKKAKQNQILFSLFQKGMGRLKLSQIINFNTRQPEQFFSQMPLIKSELTSFHKEKQTVVLQADNEERARQINQNLTDYGMDIPIVAKDNIVTARTQIVVDNFSTGFSLPSVNLVYLTERELFNQRKRAPKRVKAMENSQRLRNYNELKPGDYVVHVNHGIGRFEGIKTLETDGKKRDYITITYQHHDQLFVPADQLGLVQKYVASEGKVPHINKLGSSEWAKTKRKVQSKVEDIAGDLIDLYAKRESEKGYAFSPDDDLQRQFEDSFPYVETPDQLRSIKEIKSDMESIHPMDRLLVGDVGFGKTEVALRAAFKAIRDGKQVAFLAPTTILAQQHFETMQDRFKDFPVNVALLSRFQSNKEVKEIIADLKAGKVDLIVGTHRILSKDVQFKDLGLLIIDEEQRFGVKHKERLKELKTNIDVLTLTATPIPRTLHMSMIGVRDLSVMETPPTNRYPIQTYVMEEIPSIVREACLREMKRNGQIFFLHNRIDDIDQVTSRLQELIPEARIEFIHGRMSENQLEDIMYRFVKNEFDILVTTTIIETGVDMPNANTLIVENADHYGLSQLYQLRGRIGRSARLAYAYFLYQPNKVLTEVGEKRLSAIRDFTELGSGFKIAMRDLSIRGAGNMLGKQQHGFIDSVGYDLYSQMLDDAVKKRQGKKTLTKSNAEVQFNFEAYIPDDYISDQEQKIELYKKIKSIQSKKEADNIADELLDRFGNYPLPVENLLNVSSLKADADIAQALTVVQKDDKIQIIFNNHATKELEGPNIFKALEHVSLRARINVDPKQRLNVMLEVEHNMSTRQLFNELHRFLQEAADIVQR